MPYLNQTHAESATPSINNPSLMWQQLSSEAVHLWWLTFQQPDEDAPALGELPTSLVLRLSVLSSDERRRAERLRCPHRARRFSIGRAYLRHLLALYLEQSPGALRFAYTSTGKPYLPDAPHLCFSLAHTDNLGLLAITRDRRIGVDVELPGCAKRWLAIARRCLPAAEYHRLCDIPETDRPLAMRRCWTRHEAWLKATGQAALHRLLQIDTPLEIPCATTYTQFTIHNTQEGQWLIQDVSQGCACAALVVEGQPDESITVLTFSQPGHLHRPEQPETNTA